MRRWVFSHVPRRLWLHVVVTDKKIYNLPLRDPDRDVTCFNH